MAIDPRFNELIQADIDGEIDAADKAELDALLADSEEGRVIYGEFEALARSLDEIGELEPPAHLKHVILNAVPAQSRPGKGPGVLERLFSGPALGYVGTFAAGILLSLAVVNSSQISERAFDDVTGLVGTIADLEALGPAHGTIAIDEVEVAGTVTLRSSGTLMIIDFDLAAGRAIEIIASYSDQTIWFNGFAQLESRGASVAAETGTITLQMDGRRRSAVFLNNPSQRPVRIGLEFLADGELIHEATLDFGE